MTLVPHITFPGNCKEAMTWYQHCFGGELRFQTVGGSSHGNGEETVIADKIVSATLHTHDWKLQATDLAPNTSLQPGNTLTLQLRFSNTSEFTATYERLCEKSTVLLSPTNNHWGEQLAEVEDHYGLRWLLISA